MRKRKADDAGVPVPADDGRGPESESGVAGGGEAPVGGLDVAVRRVFYREYISTSDVCLFVARATQVALHDSALKFLEGVSRCRSFSEPDLDGMIDLIISEVRQAAHHANIILDRLTNRKDRER